MSSLTLSNITKTFGATQALNPIDLEIKDGEFCVLLGPSGCGKSTLLHIIAGLIPQNSGTVLVDGNPIDHLSPRERDVAMVFQNYALYPHLTVAENLSFGLRMRKANKKVIDERVRETARLLEIESLLNRKPRELSGGQQQRVAMGRALVRRPKFFLFDEPLSNLDARLRASVRLELKQLHSQLKGTMIYVTHDQVEAMTLGDKVVVMEKGNIHQIGPPSHIYEHPVNPFVATFIGSPEMNLYPGEVACHEDKLIFRGAGFSLALGDNLGREITGNIMLGLRPEDIRVNDREDIAFNAEVEMLSNIGSEKYIHSHLGMEILIVRAPKEMVYTPGQAVSLSIHPSHLHFFKNNQRI